MSDDAKLGAWEARFKRLFARKMGIVRPGWPDFLCVRDGKLVMVEVKGGNDWVSKRQRLTFDVLMRHGIDVYIWHASFPKKLFPWSEVRRWWCGRNYRSASLASNLRAAEQGCFEAPLEEGGDSVQGT